jgi:DNA-binding Xre family transcriptional regulator
MINYHVSLFMDTILHKLVNEALKAAKEKGLKQKDLAEISSLDEVGLSRLKKANDAKLSTIVELGKSVGKKLVWVDDTTDLPELVRKGRLF